MSNEYLNNKKFELIIEEFQTHKREKKKLELIIEDLRDSVLSKPCKNLSNYEQSYIITTNNYSKYQNELAFSFHKLSQNISAYAKFNGIDLDDAAQEGILICFEKIDKFDKNKGKAFNYMTTCVLNHFRQMYRGNRNYGEFKKKYLKFYVNKYGELF